MGARDGQRTALSTVLLVFLACLACLYTAGRQATLPREGWQAAVMALHRWKPLRQSAGAYADFGSACSLPGASWAALQGRPRAWWHGAHPRHKGGVSP